MTITMPRKSEWFERLPSILESLRAFPAPVLDRASIEILFGVSRRQAVRIADRFGGFQAGRTFLLDKAGFVSRIESLIETSEFRTEWARRQKLHARLEEDQKDLASRSISIKPVRESISIASLPPEIQLQAGRLEIEFSSTTELLGLLHCLIQTIAANYEEFEEKADPYSSQVPLLT